MEEGDDDGIMAEVDAALASRESARSPLYRWMMEHHDAFAIRLSRAAAEGKRPDWADLARRFGSRGLVDGNGRPPDAAGARRTWWRVQRRHAELHGAGGVPGPGKAPGTEPASPDPGDVLARFRSKVNERSGRKD